MLLEAAVESISSRPNRLGRGRGRRDGDDRRGPPDDSGTLHCGAAKGAIALAEGGPNDALVHLRDAVNGWRELGVPYEAAMVGVRIAEACRALGDEDGFRMELTQP